MKNHPLHYSLAEAQASKMRMSIWVVVTGLVPLPCAGLEGRVVLGCGERWTALGLGDALSFLSHLVRIT